MKKLSVIAACLATVGLLGGCGSKFDAAAYTKALLDNSYKNDSTQFVAMKIGTAEEASELYEQGLDAETSAFTASAGQISDEQEEEFRGIFADILEGAKYTVGEAEKQDDNSYVVTISYEQMQIFQPTMESYMADIEELANNMTGEETTEELTEMVIESLKDNLEAALSNVTYADSATTTVRIELINNVYTPNQDDLLNLETVLFDIEEASALLQ